MPTFSPPTVLANPPYLPDTGPPEIFNARYFQFRPVGTTVLKVGTSYTTYQPYEVTVDQVNAATIAYLGGHVYTVDTAEASALIAAGYTVT